ncbi:zinc finger domain containing protein [Entamoeba nuttalli P19]|uniref:Zinc finger domain containing protein n=1 Tax=Entamoeba nuttalli (strain P19) TaxID=1076696 RepID=K2HRP0_ENTNP|nr:zinc finger domain containing protein [Entamoeba nuttalli P19]EKE38650.1 zinc finger domain containing protein [Entamoeba nuttalli P19]|eukprot:XP_008859014.1 zinc finger domain containing protein [Entamoeba nuttalli P19]
MLYQIDIIDSTIDIITNVTIKVLEMIIIISEIILETPSVFSSKIYLIYFWSLCKGLIVILTIILCLPSLQTCVFLTSMERISHFYLSTMILLLSIDIDGMTYLKLSMSVIALIDLWECIQVTTSPPHFIDLFEELSFSEDEINYHFNFPVIKHNSTTKYHYNECPICMEPFSENESMKLLPCKHYFHCICIDEWIRCHSFCPLCKVSFHLNPLKKK